MQHLRDSINVSKQNIQRYQTSSDNSQSSSFTVSDDMYHKELNFIAGQKDRNGFNIGEEQAKKIIDREGTDYKEYHQAFQSKHLPQQRMLTPNFDYAKAVKDNIPQVNMEKDYTRISKVANSAMESSKVVTSDAKKRVEQQHNSTPNKIELAEQKIIQNGEEAQNQVDKDEEARKHWYSPGRDKVTGKKFTEE